MASQSSSAAGPPEPTASKLHIFHFNRIKALIFTVMAFAGLEEKDGQLPKDKLLKEWWTLSDVVL